jgi:hypothetical protein
MRSLKSVNKISLRLQCFQTPHFPQNTQASGWEDWSSSSLGIPLWRKHLHKLHSNNNIGHKTKLKKHLNEDGIHSSPSPLLGEGQVKLKNREFKKLHNILFKKHLVSVIFQKKVYPKNSEQNCSRHTMDNSSSLHSNKTLLTTRPNMRTSINKINKNFKQELKLKTWKRCLRKRSMMHRNWTLKNWFLKDKEACFQFFMNEKL